jgi:hypothetical protein
MDAIASLYRFLCLIRMKWEGDDRLWWIPSKIGLFGVNPSTV